MRSPLGWIASAVLALAACGGTPKGQTPICQTACQRILGCASSGGWGYGFAYSYGLGTYGYSPDLTLAQCLSGCETLDDTARTRISACVMAETTCGDVLACE